MASSKHSYALTDLSWPQIADHLTRESRLIVPVGACDQYGPHLPVGAPTVVAEALAQDLAAEFGVLRAPTFPYGVNLPAGRLFAGSATLREKTLHRALNDLLADWEENGFTEFIMITAHAFDPHLESLASVTVSQARVRVINALAIDALAIDAPRGSVASSKLEHGGELLTSLLLHLRPHLVRLESAVDIAPPEPRFPSLSRPRLTRVPDESPGSVGWPSRASRDAGERIYAHVLQKIRDRVFHSEDDTHE
jgi:creatinine amidohydrolase